MAHHVDYNEDPTLDISDIFCFRGTTGTAFVLNVSPREISGFNSSVDSQGKAAAIYEIKVDTDGDYLENLTLRASFPIVGGKKRLRVERLTGTAARDRDATGTLLAPTGTPPTQTYSGNLGDKRIVCQDGIKVFGGERGEPFFNDARWLIEIKRALASGTPAQLATLDPNTAQNTFGHSNVSAIVIEVPGLRGTIRFWGNTSIKQNGAWHQVQHAGQPDTGFFWDFAGGSAATAYNGTHPQDHKAHKDGKTGVWKQVRDQTAAVVQAMGTYDDPSYGKATALAYGAYLADTLFPDVLTYNVGTAAYWAVKVENGSRVRVHNGRGLTEIWQEAICEMIVNTPVPMGLGPEDATGKILNSFPYLSEPVVGG